MKIKTQADLAKLVLRIKECSTEETRLEILQSASFATEQLVKAACESIYPDYDIVILE